MTLEMFGHVMAVLIFIDWFLMIKDHRKALKEYKASAGQFKHDLDAAYVLYNAKVDQEKAKIEESFKSLQDENALLRKINAEQVEDINSLSRKLHRLQS